MTETAREPGRSAALRRRPSRCRHRAGPRATAPLNVTALFAEAATKSGLMWVQPPDDRAWPFWHAWADETVYAVSGPGEQTLPWLPAEVRLILRSKDTGGRLLTVQATVHEIGPADEALGRGHRGPQGRPAQRRRRRASTGGPASAPCAPSGRSAPRWRRPGRYPTTSGAAPVPPSEATTATWRPWHWRGRPRRRRGNRLPDDG